MLYFKIPLFSSIHLSSLSLLSYGKKMAIIRLHELHDFLQTHILGE